MIDDDTVPLDGAKEYGTRCCLLAADGWLLMAEAP